MSTHQPEHDCILSLEYYSSAVAMNNMGITLLERSCYQEASRIFEDAIEILPVTTGSTTKKSQSYFSPSEVEHKLYCASLHLSCAEEDGDPPALVPCNLEESESEFDDDSLSNSSFHVLNQSGQDMSFLPSETSTKHHIFYIQTTGNHQEVVGEEEISTAMALMTHNQGVAHRRLAQLNRADSKAKADSLLESSAKLFHSSRAILDGLEEPPSPTVVAAIHQTKLEVESGLGLESGINFGTNNNFSHVELEDYSIPTAAKRFESPSVSFASINDQEFESIFASAMCA